MNGMIKTSIVMNCSRVSEGRKNLTTAPVMHKPSVVVLYFRDALILIRMLETKKKKL